MINAQQLLALKSSIPGISWPALPDLNGTKMLACQYQLEASQWLPAADLHVVQHNQLQQLIKHAATTVPYYHDLFQKIDINPMNEQDLHWWEDIPLLNRDHIQQYSDKLISKKLPPSHGKLTKIQTSGSTGKAIKTWGTGITSFLWFNFTLRDHLWHGRDMTGKFAAIRPEGKLEPGKGVKRNGWGPATDTVFHTGQSIAMSVRTDIARQAEWLLQHNPDYLLSLPSNICALADHFIKNNLTLSKLKEIRCYGESVGDKIHTLTQKAWNIPLTDMYSSQEVGYIALQCPEEKQYHVQSENVFLEILDDADKPVKTGQTGKVVLTALHNFAMPLIRYEIGDYAELGKPCSCGRGLPVLKKIAGRKRNMLLRPDGQKHWPSFPAEIWADIQPIRQFQLIQTTLDTININLVVDRPLSSIEENQLIADLRTRFGYPFKMEIEYKEMIERSKGGKYEDFISMII